MNGDEKVEAPSVDNSLYKVGCVWGQEKALSGGGFEIKRRFSKDETS